METIDYDKRGLYLFLDSSNSLERNKRTNLYYLDTWESLLSKNFVYYGYLITVGEIKIIVEEIGGFL